MQDDGAGESCERVESRAVGRPGVDDDGLAELGSQRKLGLEEAQLRVVRRVVAEVVEPGLADSDRAVVAEQLTEFVEALRVGGPRVVGMDAGCREHKARIVGRALSRESRYLERLSDANDGRRARSAGTGDYRVAVAGEGRVREVGVAVDEA